MAGHLVGLEVNLKAGLPSERRRWTSRSRRPAADLSHKWSRDRVMRGENKCPYRSQIVERFSFGRGGSSGGAKDGAGGGDQDGPFDRAGDAVGSCTGDCLRGVHVAGSQLVSDVLLFVSVEGVGARWSGADIRVAGRGGRLGWDWAAVWVVGAVVPVVCGQSLRRAAVATTAKIRRKTKMKLLIWQLQRRR